VTLILSALGPQLALQAIDRLLTVHDARGVHRWDRAANKTIIFEVLDAVVCMSYTGVALIAGRQTDQWLAERILDVDAWEGGMDFGAGVPNETLGVTMGALRDALNTAAGLGQLSRSIELLAVGFQWKRRTGRARPIMWHGATRSGPNSYSIGPVAYPRHRPWPVQLAAAPDGNFTAMALSSLQCRPVVGVNAMVEAIRIAAVDRRVGPFIGVDCMAVTIDLMNRRVTTAFAAHAAEALGAVEFLDQNDPSTYTPWLLGRANVIPPQLLLGTDMEVGLGAFSARMVGLPPTGALRFYMGDQPRRTS
jgi:hypothetical protein